jgi:hypothetical protein
MLSRFNESSFVSKQLNNQDKLLVGLIYRSPSNVSNDNEQGLRGLIHEATNKGHSHILMIGDFNYLRTDWATRTTPGNNTEIKEYKFLECIQDNFYINIFTGRRDGDKIQRVTHWTSS